MAYTSLIRKEVHDVGNDGAGGNHDRDQASNGGSEADHIVIHLWSDSFLRSYVASIDKDWKLTVSKV
eukprot:scaffold99003_cov36-Cyclotella_meneghiniana.AAC.1